MSDNVIDEERVLDPLGEIEELAEQGAKHNRAKVGSGRPSSLIYTYGPGAIMDLPQLTIMPAGLDDWERIWRRRDGIPTIHAPRLLQATRLVLGYQVEELRPFPWQPKQSSFSQEGTDLGVPARIFPQWLRCTGCDLLAPLTWFRYTNTHPFRTDQACFEHAKCRGRAGTQGSAKRGGSDRTAVPARYLLACANGHLDEFPYEKWVHRGQGCAKASVPRLKMVESTAGKGANAIIVCASCDQRRPMNEAQGQIGRTKLPRCRGRLPHLDAFEPEGCGAETNLMLIGASNLWFASTESIIVMPQSRDEQTDELADQVRIALGDKLAKYASNVEIIRDLLDGKVDVAALTDAELDELLNQASQPPPSEAERVERLEKWDPVDLLVPEWTYLKRDPLGNHHTDPKSELTLSARSIGDGMPAGVTRVMAVESLRKVNALMGFTRIDAMDRVGDLSSRVVPLSRAKPTWTVATEDRGEGIFLELDEESVAVWEKRVEDSALWSAHKASHRRNFTRRFSETAEDVDPDERLKSPRYWLLHTLAHVLIREMAMSCGYSAASLSERIYAWQPNEGRPAAAGMLICTTASDSDGTLGGLVALSDPDRLAAIVRAALRRAWRCSSDPVCARRTPQDPEDFLHGAACHCCVMASETSCERANRFLDRRFLLSLPGSSLGFFARVD